MIYVSPTFLLLIWLDIPLAGAVCISLSEAWGPERASRIC